MARRSQHIFGTVRTEGGLLPADLLVRLVEEDKELPGLRPTDYHLGAKERLNEAVTRSWTRLRGIWDTFQSERRELPDSEPGTSLTRERWLLILFQELGFGRLSTARARELDGKNYAISHAWQNVPIHLVGCQVELDKRTRGVAGAAISSPYSLLQEYLNRSDDTLWAFLSNGLILRVLRDNISLTRQAYLEFDLEAMMTGEAFSDFKLLWLVCHQSRVEGERPDDFWLEKWSQLSHQEGTRILADLRAGVQEAIELFGGGFLAHPDNHELRAAISSGELNTRDYYRELLRLVYRLLFLFVAEDRGLLPVPHAEPATKERYLEHYSTQRLRRLAERRKGTRHSDLWASFKVLQKVLVEDEGYSALGLPPLGGFLWSPEATPTIAGLSLGNAQFLDALRQLAFTEKDRMLRRVDYKNLGSEELGSVYESLLELHAEVEGGEFRLTSAGGHDRKTSGSYYTPSELVQCLLDTALDPVIADRLARVDKEVRGQGLSVEQIRRQKEQAILDLKVCDPACGSGHFLIAAAHRLAAHLASARTGEGEPPPEDVRTALRDVVGRCLYGVDINPMAVELCKVSLWIEALEPGRPLSFLENKILCGNSLLGTTPRLLEQGIPDDAFAVLRGDDKSLTSTLKKQNKEERGGQGTLFADYGEGWGGGAPIQQQYQRIDSIDDSTLAGLHRKERTYQKFLDSADYRHKKLVADAWCAAFLWPKWDGAPTAITQHILHLLKSEPELVPADTRETILELSQQHPFFHWHLSFPGVFRTEEYCKDEGQGWSGGFDIVLGNPPWERVKLQEKEWFASRVPAIASAGKASERKKLIADLEVLDPEVYEEFLHDLRQSEGGSHFLRGSGRYPLCGVGDVNTYAVFAESARDIATRSGTIGCIIPSGIATDYSTRNFFKSIVDSDELHSLFDFDTSGGYFRGVGHGRYKFCLLTLARGRTDTIADFSFFNSQVSDLTDTSVYSLKTEELRTLNPNTYTCPIFRTRRDADINRQVYSKIPILIKEGSTELNPWGIKFRRVFDMNKSDVLEACQSAVPPFVKPKGSCAMYEAKMLHQYNHRFGDYVDHPPNAETTHLPDVPTERLKDPCYASSPRYWVPESLVGARLSAHWDRSWLLVFRDICRNSDFRTAIASVLPIVGTDFTIRVVFASEPKVWNLMACLNSFVFDYLVRQKMGGTHLSDYITKQLPVIPPTSFEEPTKWETNESYSDWVKTRVLELCFTSHDIAPFARDCGYEGPPFIWDEERRFQLTCELDAAFFHLYGLNRDDTAYILDTFPIVRKKDEKAHGHFRTKDRILELFDQYAYQEKSPSGRSFAQT